MGLLVAVAYAAIAVGLLAAGRALFVAESMDGVPLYDPAEAEDPDALARVLGVSLVAFAVATFAFAAFEASDGTTTIVVAGYTTLVLTIALLTAARTRKYE
ncbi:hypothetical protein [Halobacterium litoreum]|uniref:DUF3784 domain-containing protein n=1 Tax=Halobacterium litoreum TaxID=2039234 RepID=A0ABD5NIB4_9EURY|nr:hypothetical protein [Halobacterium litoreum]UHH12225.1 hypothetical protein LT972_08655 [Halobacterium litoreum]